MKKFTKFKKKINQWKKRDLTIFGKKTLINSYIISNIGYLTEIYAANIPDKFIKDTTDLIRDFLWEKPIWKVAKKTMALKKEHGGIEIPDVSVFIQSRKIKWLIRIIHTLPQNWNIIGQKILTRLDEKYNERFFILQCSKLNEIDLKTSPFYKTCLKAWTSMLEKNEITTPKEILNENLFGNKHILNHNKAIFLNHWAKSNIKQVKDVWNLESQRFRSGPEIYNKLSTKNNWIAEFEVIKKAIPEKWIKILKNDNTIVSDPKQLYNSQKLQIKGLSIKQNDSDINYTKLKTKSIYFHYLYPTPRPSCIEKWENEFEECNWKQVWNLTNNPIISNKKKQLQWKFIHRAIYSVSRLASMGKSNGICMLCKAHEEDIHHLFVKCKMIERVWSQLELWLSKLFNVHITVKDKEKCLGIWKEEFKEINYIINLIIIEAK